MLLENHLGEYQLNVILITKIMLWWAGAERGWVITKVMLPTNLLDTIMTIAERRADQTTDRVRTEQERKLTRLQRNKDKKRPKTDENWVRNISLLVP